jgi:hypothetical protein
MERGMLWIGFVLLVGVMAAPWVLTRCVGRLPYAPGCPHCSTVTGQRPPQGAFERAYSALTASGVRTCTRCGWAGRMRWRLAPERVSDRR